MTAPSGASAGVDGNPAIHVSPGLHWSQSNGWACVSESIVAEAPLAIEITYHRSGREISHVLAVTMRTPGEDAELATGFLLAEGLISGLADIADHTTAAENARGEAITTQRLRLMHAPREDLQRLSRGLVTSSACGVCGRPSLEGLPLRRLTRASTEPLLSPEIVVQLPALLRKQQVTFSATGGSHGAALSDASGQAYLVREDVGRHNAVDKLIGAALFNHVPCAGKILVVSGRASFELVQKAAAAGVPTLVAVGAPSSLAVTLAHAAGITLIGFTRDGRFNVYAHADRLDLHSSKSGLAPHAPPFIDAAI